MYSVTQTGVLSPEETAMQEKIHFRRLQSGAGCYIIPKNGYRQAQAAIALPFGSAALSRREGGDILSSPPGTAHFIEHRLFIKEDGDVFSKLAKTGASANALTDFNKTAYYFSCTDGFYDNLALLIDMVQTPYFTEEGVNDEKSIISQEIKMYGDDASWQAYFNLLGAMYHNTPVKYEIAGSLGDIEEITHKTLMENYMSFYTPENMTLVCSGGVDFERIADIAERHFIRTDRRPAEIVSPAEPEDIVKPFIRADMGLSQAVISVGFKQKPYCSQHPLLRAKRQWAYKIIFELIFGETSSAYNEMLERGLVSEPLGFEHISGKGYAASIISASTNEPERVFERICKGIERAKTSGIALNAIESARKKLCGRFIRGQNSIDAVVMGQLNYALSLGMDMKACYIAMYDITHEYIEALLKEDFREDRLSLSVVY